MAEIIQLSQDTYQAQESSLARRQKRHLNPIIEEDSDDGMGGPNATSDGKARLGGSSHLKIQAWLSPVSDHFPTPRGMHYLAAPILPSSPSTVSGADSSPSSSSNPWNRASVATDNTEFEDLYDVSEEEEEDQDVTRRLRRSSTVKMQVQASNGPVSKQPTPLIIPTGPQTSNDVWSAVDGLKKLASPMPPTPSAKLQMSPAQLEFMGKQQALEVPTISAPPSLDGSLSSEQLAALSAPATPIIGNDEAAAEEAWTGVHLQPGALATLHAISSGEDDLYERPSQVIEIPDASPHITPEMSQQPLRLVTNFLSPVVPRTTVSPNTNRYSLDDLTRLEIPSPGGFFSGLSPRTRSTWHVQTTSPDALHPPTSTTAEQFYRCPWNAEVSDQAAGKRSDVAEDFYRSFDPSSLPVEQVVEVQDDDVSDDIPTARPFLQLSDSNSLGLVIKAPSSPRANEAATEIVTDYDPDYARKQREIALSHLDRTELWLMAQRAYLKGVDSVSVDAPIKPVDIAPITQDIGDENQPESKPPTASRKKVVRFSIMSPPAVEAKQLPSKILRSESAYYRAFLQYIVRAQQKDVFVQQLSRYEALQAQRVGLREAHRNQLLGKYQLSVVPQSAKKRLSANVVRGDLDLTDDPEKLRKEKEYEASTQMAMPAWHVAAVKYLNGGRLVTAPVTRRLARASQSSSDLDRTACSRVRVLDLAGQSTCDWAWHCALQYPGAKVYTVTTKAVRQLSNSNIRGPSNHHQVAVERLTRLPFPRNYFDLISARELHTILKLFGENGQDEWEACIEECMRVLKPGGYLEFSILDSDIVNAGPLGLAKSVEFGFSLKTLGYDPTPSKLWLGRLNRAGFEDVRRMWMCLPLGAKKRAQSPPAPFSDDSQDCRAQAASLVDDSLMGSSDNIANVCSIVGGWSWERWLLRCEMEKIAGEVRLADTVTTGAGVKEAGKCLDGVHAVMEEGRSFKSGFRMLNGYARKPRVVSGEVIQIALAN